MKVIFFVSVVYIFFSCSKESGSVTGSWVTEMDDEPQHKYGFTLENEGTASSINMGYKDYQKWEQQGNRLVFFGKDISLEESPEFTDTLKIISVNDSTLVLERSGGRKTTYTKTTDPDRFITNFLTYDCYQYETKQDTAFMHINISDGVVSGNLEYNLFEKDLNDGKIKGKIIADTLFASYTFVSEGSESVREMIFIKKENGWLQGVGELEEKAGSVIFKDRTKLEFTKGLLFKSTECP